MPEDKMELILSKLDKAEDERLEIQERVDKINERLERAEQVTDPVHALAGDLTEKMVSIINWLIISAAVAVAYLLVTLFGKDVTGYFR